VFEHVLERVVGKEAYNFLDGFVGYNQVSIDPNCIIYYYKVGGIAYRVTLFGLTNALATF